MRGRFAEIAHGPPCGAAHARDAIGCIPVSVEFKSPAGPVSGDRLMATEVRGMGIENWECEISGDNQGSVVARKGSSPG